MEKNSNKGVIALLIIIIIIILAALCILFATETISFKNNNSTSEKSSIDKVEKKSDIEDIQLKILSIDELKVGSEYVNHKMYVYGKMELSYNEDKYFPLTMSGYCIDDKNIRYNIYGPGSGAISYYNSDTTFALVNTINNENGDIILEDGTTKKISDIEIDWDNIKIKSCVIEKLNAFTKESNSSLSKEMVLNIKKNFTN